jgi:hypothetical protein
MWREQELGIGGHIDRPNNSSGSSSSTRQLGERESSENSGNDEGEPHREMVKFYLSLGRQ